MLLKKRKWKAFNVHSKIDSACANIVTLVIVGHTSQYYRFRNKYDSLPFCSVKVFGDLEGKKPMKTNKWHINNPHVGNQTKAFLLLIVATRRPDPFFCLFPPGFGWCHPGRKTDFNTRQFPDPIFFAVSLFLPRVALKWKCMYKKKCEKWVIQVCNNTVPY